MKQEADDIEVESDRTTLESATTLLHPPPTPPTLLEPNSQNFMQCETNHDFKARDNLNPVCTCALVL